MTDEWREGLLADLQALGHEVDDERIAMTRERRDSSGAVGPRGPVQLRSRELGRKRIRARS